MSVCEKEKERERERERETLTDFNVVHWDLSRLASSLVMNDKVIPF